MSWEEVAEKWGLPGLVLIALAVVVRLLYKSREDDRKAHAAELARINEARLAESKAWIDVANKQQEATRVVLDKIVSTLPTRRGG